MERKIGIIIITGFLGAGKTTLLNKLVAAYGDKQIGLLVNDFGRVPVDGSLIQSSYSDVENNRIYEIGNGSIFCSCLTSSFVFGLKYFRKLMPEILFIETSGMSDPGSMARLLNEYELGDAFEILHVLAVVDSTNMMKMRANLTFVDRQITASNTVLLNKSDLVTAEHLTEVEKTVRGINGAAVVKAVSFCEFDYTSLGQTEFLPERDYETCNTPSNKPGTMYLQGENFHRAEFEKFMASLQDRILRLKGYWQFGDEWFYYSNNNGTVESSQVNREITAQAGITLIYEKEKEEEITALWRSFREVYS